MLDSDVALATFLDYFDGLIADRCATPMRPDMEGWSGSLSFIHWAKHIGLFITAIPAIAEADRATYTTPTQE